MPEPVTTTDFTAAVFDAMVEMYGENTDASQIKPTPEEALKIFAAACKKLGINPAAPPEIVAPEPTSKVLSVRLPTAEHKALCELAAAQGNSPSVYLRRCLATVRQRATAGTSNAGADAVRLTKRERELVAGMSSEQAQEFLEQRAAHKRGAR